jgi:hypothetical protein
MVHEHIAGGRGGHSYARIDVLQQVSLMMY